MNRDTPLIVPDYFLRYAESLKQLGFDPGKQILPTHAKNTASASYSGDASLNQVAQILAASYDQLKIPHLGLVLGNQLKLTVHGMVGVSVMAQPSYADYLRAAGRFCERAFPPLTMEYFETTTTVGLNIFECLSLAPSARLYLESIMVNFCNILHFLLGDDHEPDYIAFAFPEPSHAKEYRRYFKCKILFNTENHTFVVPRHIAQRELRLADQHIARVAEQEFFQSLPGTNTHDLRSDLRRVLIKHLNSNPSLDDIAQHLRMSGRTLRRQLTGQGTNFQNELSLVRQELAMGYLMSNDRCITDIALMLGFCDSRIAILQTLSATGHENSD